MLYVKKIIKSILNAGSQLLCKREFYSMTFNQFCERPVELAFLFRHLGAIYPKHILDVGTGMTALPSLFRDCGCLATAMDNIHDYWPAGMYNRHYHVINDDITATQLTGPFDMITCISVLEHIHKADDAMKGMFSLMKPDGHMVLTCPYTENSYIHNVYDLPDSSYGQNAPYITQSFSRNELNRWLEKNNAEIVEQEYWQFWQGEHWTEGQQIIPPVKVGANEKHQITCLLLKKSAKNQ